MFMLCRAKSLRYDLANILGDGKRNCVFLQLDFRLKKKKKVWFNLNDQLSDIVKLLMIIFQ